MTIRVATGAVSENLILGTPIKDRQTRQASRKGFHARNFLVKRNTTLLSPQFLF
jgi:hypothetical protein